MPPSTLFNAALMDLEFRGAEFSMPKSFREYAKTSDRPEAKTAPSISVDSLDALSADLKNANTMVFRLGSPAGEKHTQFALARTKNGWDDYFLQDNKIFKDLTPEPFIPNVPYNLLYSFTLLPAYTETSVVNLALASGLAAHALGIDPTSVPSAPATGRTTSSFNVRPHTSIETNWSHEKGQVEIDAIFIGRRKGDETLFVLEAKCTPEFSSLAKHKLVYPLLALRQNLPAYLGLCPVYMRVIKRNGELVFYFAECKPWAPKSPQHCIDELIVAKCSAYSLAGFG